MQFIASVATVCQTDRELGVVAVQARIIAGKGRDHWASEELHLKANMRIRKLLLNTSVLLAAMLLVCTLEVCSLEVFTLKAHAQNPQTTRRWVQLEISAGARASVGTQQRWMEMLQDVGADRVTSITSGVGSIGVEEMPSGELTIVKVHGTIDGRKLRLPGGAFSISDKGRIRDLLAKIRDDGARVALAEKKAFGLTAEQLVGLHEQLAITVDIETKDQPAGETFNSIAGRTGLTFVFDETAKQSLRRESKVRDELKGLSAGTALAAIARPLGLVVEPKRLQGKPLEIHVVDSRESSENWPVGWPPQDIPVAVAPKLFERIPMEIRGFPIVGALDAIQKRSEVAFLYDHNTMAREGIELAETKVDLVEKKIGLMLALSKLLRQTKPKKMSTELRVDEAGKPFLWISVR